jgi:hypothetical protein
VAERSFFDVMKEAIAEIAPAVKNAGAEMGAELSRLGTQGAMEMAHALFNGSAFTPYGPGQQPAPDVGQGVHGAAVEKAEPQPEQQRERGGMEM